MASYGAVINDVLIALIALKNPAFPAVRAQVGALLSGFTDGNIGV
jgi:hypothetical protein